MEIIAQIFGILAMICYVISYQLKKGSYIILTQLVGSTFYTLQYVFFSIIDSTIYMGLLMNFLGILRAIVYYKRDFFHADNIAWLFGFIVVYFVCYGAIFLVWNMKPTIENLILEFLPIIGKILTTIGYKLKEPQKIRAFAALNSIPWGTYHLAHHSIGGTIGEIFNFFSAIIGLFLGVIKTRKKDLNDKKHAVNEMHPKS